MDFKTGSNRNSVKNQLNITKYYKLQNKSHLVMIKGQL